MGLAIMNALSCTALAMPQSGQSGAIGRGPNAFTGNDAGHSGDAPMSITSKLLLTALLVGATLPAFAQGSVQPSVQGSASVQPTVTKIAPKSTSIHKAATTESVKPVTVKPDAAKTDAAKTDATKTDGAKTDAAKTDMTKTDTTKTDAVKTGATAPVVTTPAKPVTKVN
jgi:hypothetical protein